MSEDKKSIMVPAARFSAGKFNYADFFTDALTFQLDGVTLETYPLAVVEVVIQEAEILATTTTLGGAGYIYALGDRPVEIGLTCEVVRNVGQEQESLFKFWEQYKSMAAASKNIFLMLDTAVYAIHIHKLVYAVLTQEKSDKETAVLHCVGCRV